MIDVLEALAGSERPMSIPDMIAKCGLTTPSAHRITKMLLDMGLIERDAERRYHEGRRLLDLSYAAIAAASQRGARHLILKALSDEVGENCHFCVQDGSDAVSIAYAEAQQQLGIRLQPGMRLPLHCSAAGKLLLALMPADARSRMIANLSLRKLATRTITSADALHAEIAVIGRRNYATAESEALDGVTGVAVPVVKDCGKVIGVLLVTAPISRKSPKELQALLPRIRLAAAHFGATF